MEPLTQTQRKLISHALSCVGMPFEYGASTQGKIRVFDCSSLTQYVYHQIAVALPRSSIEQAGMGKRVTLAELAVGDLLFFHGKRGHYNSQFPQGIGHVALYLGNSRAIHASGRSGRVVETTLRRLKRRGDLVVIKRILSEKVSQSPQGEIPSRSLFPLRIKLFFAQFR